MKLKNDTAIEGLISKAAAKARKAQGERKELVEGMAEGRCLDWGNAGRIVTQQTIEGFWSYIVQIAENTASEDLAESLVGFAGRKYGDVSRRKHSSGSTNNMANAIEGIEADTIRSEVQWFASMLAHYCDLPQRDIEFAIIEESTSFGGIL
jgi:hypothetical protein